MVRALLVKPRNLGFDKRLVEVSFEPLGLMCLSAFVKKYSDHHVDVVDAQAECPQTRKLPDGRFRRGMSDEQLGEVVRRLEPDVVGIACLFEWLAEDAVSIARVVRREAPSATVVVGGMDASARYEEYLSSEEIDLVVVGSGEEVFLEILDAIDRGEDPTGIPGTCEKVSAAPQIDHDREIGASVVCVSCAQPTVGRAVAEKDERVRVNPRSKPRVPFDEYPFPDRDCLPRRLYDDRRNQGISYPFARDYPAMLIQSSRGCPLRCAFCEIISVFDVWQAHGAEYVVGEIEECVRKYGAREFIFLDDNFMLRTKRVEEICRLIVQRGLKVSFDVLPGISVWTLSERLIDLMVEAGLYRVCLPIESGNPKTLEFIRKPVNLDRTRQMIDYCNRKGLLTYGNLIIGFPYETEEDIRRTLAWGRQSGLDAINYFVAQPVKGARMYAIYEENKWFEQHESAVDADHSWRAHASWRTAHFTSEELGRMAKEASSRYLVHRFGSYLIPTNAVRYVWPKMNSIRKAKYVAKVAAYIFLGGTKVIRSSAPLTPLALLRGLFSETRAAAP